ncbi:MAG: hypothetical protein Q9195_007770 [Heterodermia aff. obscurata]
MSTSNSQSPFFTLPLEIRDQIYGYVIHGVIPIKKSSQTTMSPERFDWSGTSLFLLNHQIYFEASRVLLSSTFTITVHENGVEFLGTTFDKDLSPYLPISKSGQEAFPLSFPYHKVRAMRIRIHTPREAPRIVHETGRSDRLCARSTAPWKRFERSLRKVDEMLCAITKKKKATRAFRKLIIDAASWSLCQGPARDSGLVVYTDISRLFGTLGLSEGIAREYEIRVSAWAKTCAETRWVIGLWGRRITDCGGENDREGGEPVVVFVDTNS